MSDKENTRGGGKHDAGLSGADESVKKSLHSIKDDEGGDGGDAWWEDRTIPQKVLIVIGFVILGLGLITLFGWVVMLLWNWLMPELFGLKQITYWQAWGLLALCMILFKNFPSSSGSGSSDRKRKKKLRRYIQEEMCKDEERASDSTEA